MSELTWTGTYFLNLLFWLWLIRWGGAERLEGTFTSGLLLSTFAPRWSADGIRLFAWLARRGELHAIVTGPIHKARMYEAGFKFPGQTEFFAERCAVKNFAMCLTSGKLTVALVTSHIPLAKVPGALKQSEIVRVGLLLAEFLHRRSANQNLNAKSIQVRIAVCGLNPHAG